MADGWKGFGEGYSWCALGLDADIKPLLSRSTTGNLNFPNIFTDAEKVPELRVVHQAPIKPLHHWKTQFSPQMFADTTCTCRALVWFAPCA
eukprot:629658-Pyramimonas_sp.AAC.1